MKKLNVVFEDEQVLMVEKPAGLVVNRSETTREETLQDWVEQYLQIRSTKHEIRNKFKIKNSNFQNDFEFHFPKGNETISNFDFFNRAGIVHRLDRETSGLLIVAKTKKAFENLQKQFAQRKVEKVYIALVHGKVKETQGSIESAIARIGKFGKFGVVEGRPSFTKVTEGKEARTDYKLEELYTFGAALFDKILKRVGDDKQVTKSRVNYLKQNAREYSLLSVYPKTGRTHQVRVHLKSLGHPLVSDLIYTPAKLIKFDLMWCPRLFLHASKLAFEHPKTQKRVEFESDLPNDLKRAILNLDRSTTKV